MSTQRSLSRWLNVLLVFGCASAYAAPPTLARLGVEYATKNGLPVRGVKMDLGTRQVERHFVPVLPTTHDDFIATFQEKNGAIILKHNGDANTRIHSVISVKPGDVMSYSSPGPDVLKVLPYQPNGRYITMAVTGPQLASWRDMIKKGTNNGAVPVYPTGVNTFTAWAKANGIAQVFGGCMWWISHADLGGVNLAHLMGVRRAKGPEVLEPRLIHAGNELVGPIGVSVQSVEQFMAMKDVELMGPEPAGGAADQVK